MSAPRHSATIPGLEGPGDIVNALYYDRAKEYLAAAACAAALPRRISPTDIDLAWEIGGCFLFFEGKTRGSELPTGQRLFYQRLIEAIAPQRAALVVCWHPPTRKQPLDSGLDSFMFGWRSPGGFHTSRQVDGGLFVDFLALWGADADRATPVSPLPLRCPDWARMLGQAS
jgi:hypothetical protein